MTSSSPQPKRAKLNLSLEPTSTSTTSPSTSSTLSERLLRLWDQRGDFSQFDALKLKKEVDEKKQKEREKEQQDEQIGNRQNKFSLNLPDFQIEDDISETEKEDKEKNMELKGEEEAKEKTKKENPTLKNTITSSQMLEIRQQMLTSLNQAHSDMFYLSSLLTYVQNFSKPPSASATSQTASTALIKGQQTLSVARATSPGSSIAGTNHQNPKEKSSKGGGPGSINDQSTHSQPQLTPAEELGLDMNVLGMSFTESLEGARKARLQKTSDRNQNQRRDDEEDEEEEEEEDQWDETPNFKSLEIKERIDENSLLIAKKRNGIGGAAEILRNGAQALYSSRIVSPQATPPPPQNPHTSEMLTESSRNSISNPIDPFPLLQSLKSQGWGLNPSKPQLPKNVFGMSMEIGGQVSNEDVSNYSAGGGIGARDCLIGWGVGEAIPHFRKQSFAYVNSSSNSNSSSENLASSSLTFPARNHRRLRVVFVVRSLGEDGEIVEERFGSERRKFKKSQEEVKDQEGEGDVEMQEVELESQNQDSKKTLDQELDQELREAQREMIDEELFSQLVGQYRRMGDTFGIEAGGLTSLKPKDKGKGKGKEKESFKPKPTLSANHLSLELNDKVELRFEMVTRKSKASTFTSKAEGEEGGKQRKKKEKEQKVAEEIQVTDIGNESYRYSPVANLIKGFVSMEMIRRYRERAGVSGTSGKKERVGGDTLGCLLEVIGYFKFVTHLEHLLLELVVDHNTGKTQDQSLNAPSQESQAQLELRFNPLSNIKDLGVWVENLLLGKTDISDRAGSQSKSLKSIVKGLGGTGTIWRGDRPLAILTFSTTSNLTLQFPGSFTPNPSVSQKATSEKNAGEDLEAERSVDGGARIINGLSLRQLKVFLLAALEESS